MYRRGVVVKGGSWCRLVGRGEGEKKAVGREADQADLVFLKRN